MFERVLREAVLSVALRRSLDGLSDEDLAGLAAGGDRRALERLLTRHADRVVAICRRVLSNPEDAHDAAQEAMIAVARGIGNFDGRSKFTTWLYRVATNSALDEARRKQRRPVPVETLPERTSGPDIAKQITDRLVIDAGLSEIPAEFRACVVLRDVLGLDYAEIAEVLAIPAGTVRSRIARGRAALGQQLVDNDDDRKFSADFGNQSPGHTSQSGQS